MRSFLRHACSGRAESFLPGQRSHAVRGNSVVAAQPVADTGFGQDVLRLRGIRFDLVAQLAYVDAKIVGFVHVRRAPHLPQQLLVGDDLPCVGHEHAEQFILRGREFHVVSSHLYDTPGKVDAEIAVDKDGIIAAGKQDGVKLVFLCSPNNPTATSFPHDEIAEICDALEGHAMVILDETYAEFSQAGSMVDDLESTPNLIILRTLSKSYAFAGMRLGCFISGDKEFIHLCRTKALDAYPLPLMTIEAAFHVLSPEISAIAHENIKKILAERERVKGLLLKSKQVVHIYPSDANFLLVELKDAKGFAEFAKARNVILRDFSGKAGTENCLRISIGLPEENEVMLKLLKEFA